MRRTAPSADRRLTAWRPFFLPPDWKVTGLTLAEIQSVLELTDSGATSCDHTRRLVERHLADIDSQIARLAIARAELVELAT